MVALIEVKESFRLMFLRKIQGLIAATSQIDRIVSRKES